MKADEPPELTPTQLNRIDRILTSERRVMIARVRQRARILRRRDPDGAERMIWVAELLYGVGKRRRRRRARRQR